MNKRINFEDNIFILMMRIRIIKDVIALDADPELFLEKTLDDIYFSDNTLKILLGYIQENQRLIDLDELLEHYSEVEWQFSNVITELMEHEGNISIRGNRVILDKLTALRNTSLERREIAGSLGSAGSIVPGSPVVSSDELTELLKAF